TAWRWPFPATASCAAMANCPVTAGAWRASANCCGANGKTERQPAGRMADFSARPSMKPEDLVLLVTRSMPYGKYEGRLIADLPGDYLGWFARKGFPKGEIGRLLALMHEIDHNGLNALLEPLR